MCGHSVVLLQNELFLTIPSQENLDARKTEMRIELLAHCNDYSLKESIFYTARHTV